MDHQRRLFLQHAARLAAIGATGATLLPASTIAAGSWTPFRLGVASGSPLPNAVVLWTRILSEPGNPEAPAPGRLGVRWEVAEDQAFRHIVASGTASALPELAHSVHVDVTGLRPDRWYWYRFMLGDAVSPVARTRTAPAPDAMPANMRLAYASCQHWDFGEYAAHRHIAGAAPDLVAFLGDYIYEWGPYAAAHPSTARRTDETVTLADYRARYAQYKADPQLQAAHHAAPWIVTWDDHEVSNDDANDRDGPLDPDFMLRRAAAYQAFYEHMPVRLSALPNGPGRYAHMRIYQRYDWGRLARFHLLDTRQYRSHQACPRPGRGGSNSVDRTCVERLQPERTLLGAEQEAWLAQGLAASPARWNVLAQQTLMAQCSQTPVARDGGRFWTDGWDGYPAARARLMDTIARHRPANPLVISGDVHSFFASDLRRDFDRPASTGNPVLATEFCGTSVTSNSRPQSRTEQYLAMNPHIRYGRSDRRGFVLMDLTPQACTVLFQALDDVRDAGSGIGTVATFTVPNGRPGVVPAA
jgi:alkaline phosphatase D